MRRVCWAILLLAAAGCGNVKGDAATDQQTTKPETPKTAGAEKVREPAVAGMFYPGDAKELTAMIDGFLAGARKEPLGRIRGLIAPHAGYRYSGPTAAFAYKQVEGGKFDTVVVIGPSHYAAFEGASIADATAFATPLGRIPLSPKAAALAAKPPFCRNPACRVQRPGWWRQSAKEAPPDGQDTPDTWEHSLEVQLPFLQRVLGRFALAPAVFGHVDPEKAAEALADVIDEKTLIVASSDLSHYHPYDAAKGLDSSCVGAICALDTQRMAGEEACGKLPILTLMHLAKQRGWKAKLLDYRNSGDTSGDRSGVVGYAAIAFYDEGKPAKQADTAQSTGLSPQQGALLLTLARKTVEDVVNFRGVPKVDRDDVPERLREPGACFVTLTKHGQLRGCLGHIFAREPLYEAVLDNARQVTFADPRFPPVTREELGDLEVEVSVLSTPRPLEYGSPEELLKKLRPGVDGVVLRRGQQQATYLPQVWEKLPRAEVFLNSLSEKAGLPPSAWKDPGVEVLTYQAEAFGGKEEEKK